MIAGTTVWGFFGSVALTWAIVMLGLTVCLTIWGLSLWHAVHFKSVPHRTAWIVVIIVIPVIGATVYYFFTLLPYNRAHPYVRPPEAAQPPRSTAK